MDKIYSIKRTDISPQQYEDAKKTINQLCPELFDPQQTAENEGFIIILAFAKLLDEIPLLTWIIDVYHRMLLNKWIKTKEFLTPSEFGRNYQWMQYLKIKSNPIYMIFEHIPKTFHKRLFLFPEQQPGIRYLYDDDINDYIEITDEINSTLHNAIQVLYHDDNVNIYPSQFDVWIIPKNVIRADIDASTTNNQQSKPQQTQKINGAKFDKNDPWFKNHQQIGNIKQKIQKLVRKKKINKFVHFKVSRKNDNVSWKQVFKSKLKLRSRFKKKYSRYILIIDRRKEFKNKIAIYFYDAPTHQMNAQTFNYFRCPNFVHSQKCILPKDDDEEIKYNPKTIGLFDQECGYMFGLSYHINSPSSISQYWMSGGSGVRILASDMKKVWPWYFVVDKHTKKNQIVIKEHLKEFVDSDFSRFYKITTGKDFIGTSHVTGNDVTVVDNIKNISACAIATKDIQIGDIISKKGLITSDVDDIKDPADNYTKLISMLTQEYNNNVVEKFKNGIEEIYDVDNDDISGGLLEDLSDDFDICNIIDQMGNELKNWNERDLKELFDKMRQALDIEPDILFVG